MNPLSRGLGTGAGVHHYPTMLKLELMLDARVVIEACGPWHLEARFPTSDLVSVSRHKMMMVQRMKCETVHLGIAVPGVEP